MLFKSIVVDGIYASKAMMRFDDVLSTEDLAALHDYLIDKEWRLNSVGEVHHERHQYLLGPDNSCGPMTPLSRGHFCDGVAQPVRLAVVRRGLMSRRYQAFLFQATGTMGVGVNISPFRVFPIGKLSLYKPSPLNLDA